MLLSEYENLVADCHESVEKILEAIRDLEYATQTLRERAQRARNLIIAIDSANGILE